MRSTFVIVSYDIRNDKRRNKIHKTLKNFGQRVQYSVFECEVSKIAYLKLRDRLDHLIEEGDNIRFYFLCEACRNTIERIGGELPFPDDLLVI
ncbi:MAG: CRISPR-associated endonuclease Cas2 [Deltaproteobacteria bacterium]|nr:MAG: CRISPR-associated endonuclease Cas2 [Deltaproteobacteria bacterium]